METQVQLGAHSKAGPLSLPHTAALYATPPVVVMFNIKLCSLLICNCNFATVMHHNVNPLCFLVILVNACEMVIRGLNPQVENYYPKVLLSAGDNEAENRGLGGQG